MRKRIFHLLADGGALAQCNRLLPSGIFRRYGRLWVVLLVMGVAWGAGALPGSAQEVGRVGNVTATGVPYKVYAEAGEATIRVHLIGGDANGIYEIGADTRLDELLALSPVSTGGQSANARQEVTVRLYRTTDAGRRTVVLERRLEDLLAADPGSYPALQEGDFVSLEVRTRERFGWRDGLQIFSTLLSVALLVDRIRR